MTSISSWTITSNPNFSIEKPELAKSCVKPKHEYTQAILKLRLPQSAKEVLFVLVDMFNPNVTDNIFPRKSTVIERTSKSARSVERGFYELCKKGYLVIFDTFQIEGGGQGSSRFYLPCSIFDPSKVNDVLSLPPRMSQIKNKPFKNARETFIEDPKTKEIIGYFTPTEEERWPSQKWQRPNVKSVGRPDDTNVGRPVAKKDDHNLKVESKSSTKTITRKKTPPKDREITGARGFVEEGALALGDSLGFRITEKQIGECKKACEKFGIEEGEFLKNLELVQRDPLVKYTTLSFARLGYPNSSIVFGTKRLKKDLAPYVGSASLHEYHGFNTSFQSHRGALKAVFPMKYRKKIDSINIDSEFKGEFLRGISDKDLFSNDEYGLERHVENFLREAYPKSLTNKEKIQIKENLESLFPRAFKDLARPLQERYIERVLISKALSFRDLFALYGDLHRWISEHSFQSLASLVTPEDYDPAVYYEPTAQYAA